jgi:N-acetyl-anhydromuramyl-L-alanine amidase AmpD
MQPLAVIHESLTDYETTIAYCQSPTLRGSYHSIIRRDGRIIHLAPPTSKCYGCGPSSFYGEEVNGSVDPFAYHICLESPPSIALDAESHSGYTSSQYESLAYELAWAGIPPGRIALHREVDGSKTAIDPRSFDIDQLRGALIRLDYVVEPKYIFFAS